MFDTTTLRMSTLSAASLLGPPAVAEAATRTAAAATRSAAARSATAGAGWVDADGNGAGGALLGSGSGAPAELGAGSSAENLPRRRLRAAQGASAGGTASSAGGGAGTGGGGVGSVGLEGAASLAAGVVAEVALLSSSFAGAASTPLIAVAADASGCVGTACCPSIGAAGAGAGAFQAGGAFVGGKLNPPGIVAKGAPGGPPTGGGGADFPTAKLAGSASGDNALPEAAGAVDDSPGVCPNGPSFWKPI
mmetsp:Transcript_44091/g.82479  ORF Transcript_44091/g.82479 Transcript_44091/m.82479 type:complete len:249 (+) Transcript_44091:1463-2209(+)